jgi:hypothetical protein
MTYQLEDYNQFGGQVDTGTVANVLDYQSVRMPHTNQPPTQALLFGLTGGVVAGYFAFEYTGTLPYLHFLTRNTFDPMQKMMDRLGIEADSKQTQSADKGVENLVNALAAGRAPLVFVSYPIMPYTEMAAEADNHYSYPVIIYAYDAETGTVLLSDRAQVPLGITAEQLNAARSQPKKNKYQLITLSLPNTDKLNSAVEAGIQETIESFVGEPPRQPMRGKYGLSAYNKWAELLVANTKDGWAKQFPPGERMLSGLSSAYHYANLWITAAPHASRDEYGSFLDEAAIILEKPGLKQAAEQWRTAAQKWDALNAALLPESIPSLYKVRQLMDKHYRLFLEMGRDSDDQRTQLHNDLEAHKKAVSKDFPLDDAGAADLRESIREAVLAVKEAEAEAVLSMQAAMD